MAPAELTLLSKPPGWALSLLCACIPIIGYPRNGSLSCLSCCHTSPLLPYHPKTLGRTIILPGFPVCLGDKEAQPSPVSWSQSVSTHRARVLSQTALGCPHGQGTGREGCLGTYCQPMCPEAQSAPLTALTLSGGSWARPPRDDGTPVNAGVQRPYHVRLLFLGYSGSLSPVSLPWLTCGD